METTIASKLGGVVFTIIGIFSLNGAWKTSKISGNFWTPIGLGIVGVLILTIGLGMVFAQQLSNTLSNYSYVSDAFNGKYVADPTKVRDPQVIDTDMTSVPRPFDSNVSKMFGNYDKAQSTDLSANAALVNFNTSNSYDGSVVSGTVGAPGNLASSYTGYSGPSPAGVPSNSPDTEKQAAMLPTQFTTTEDISEPSSFKFWSSS